ncbi:MAG: hypothetical protein ABFC57_09080, partial [Veillonellales bacterium]
GIIVSPDILQSAIRSWGPKPFFFDVRAAYITGGAQDRRTIEEICTYFATRIFSDIGEFCNSIETGFVLNVDTSNLELRKSLRQRNQKI